MHKILIVGDRLFMKFPDFSYVKERAAEADAEIVLTQDMTDAQIRDQAHDASGIVVIGHPITREIMENAPQLKLIMTLSVGYDVVDVEAATELGIIVSNSPTYCSEEVAEHALSLILALSRKIHELIPHVQTGGWDYKQTRPLHSFRTRTLGIIGLGRIGRQSAQKAAAFGMSVAAYDPYVDDDVFAMLDVKRHYDLGPMLREVDAVTIHAPLTDETYHLIDDDALGTMQKHAIVVNTARGGIVDRLALERALKSGAISGAGIDVLETEPPTGDEELLHLPNAIVTPHIAWYSEESHRENEVLGMDELVRVLNGQRPRYIVNPQIFSRR